MATMRDLASLLGVEIGERFDARSTKFDNLRYSGLLFTDDGFDDNDSEIRIEQLFNGEFSVIKRPFRPNMNDTYYYAAGTAERFTVYSESFCGCLNDLEHYFFGNCFKNEMDARKYAGEAFYKLKSRYDEEGELA